MSTIHSDMTLHDILHLKPHAESLFFESGILSEKDRIRSHETIREACASHGLSEKEMETLMERIKALP